MLIPRPDFEVSEAVLKKEKLLCCGTILWGPTSGKAQAASAAPAFLVLLVKRAT